jgi:hypothetical protein
MSLRGSYELRVPGCRFGNRPRATCNRLSYAPNKKRPPVGDLSVGADLPRMPAGRIRTSDPPALVRDDLNRLSYAPNKKGLPWETFQWAQKDSNLRPPACKAGALNRLSYAPLSLCCQSGCKYRNTHLTHATSFPTFSKYVSNLPCPPLSMNDAPLPCPTRCSSGSDA